MGLAERDQQIALEYLRGDSASVLSRRHKLSVATIRRITSKQRVCRKETNQPRIGQKAVVSGNHLKLGTMLYTYRFRKGLELSIAADLIGWSAKKLSNVEQSQSEITLSELVEISKYMGLSLSELAKRIE